MRRHLFWLATLLVSLNSHAATPEDENRGGIGGTGHDDGVPDIVETPEIPERIESIDETPDTEFIDSTSTTDIESVDSGEVDTDTPEKD